MNWVLIFLAGNTLVWWMGYQSGKDSVEIAHNTEQLRLLKERNALLRQSLGTDGSREGE